MQYALSMCLNTFLKKEVMLREINRAIKEKGKLFLSVPLRNRNYNRDDRQPFDDPPTLFSLIYLIREKYRLNLIRGFYGINPFSRIYPLFRFFSSLVKHFPYMLIGSQYISLEAAKK
jgi:hypothetical protein